ncbi:PDR/VanB family oxidoreductase [Pseudonocardia sp. GCM10023141]|uniref:PDR/VanB family oxidoreductase n=1 Tax=Pseudonocardia sp. GCM10023141 TaxID=3252653 RepID=UPI00361AEFA5
MTLALEIETTAVVESRHDAADGVVVLTLRGELREWEPGAHVDVVLPDGSARQYSLCGDPADPHRWRLGVLDEPAGRGGSRYIHRELHPGASVQVRGPRNHFTLSPSPRYLFIAGGIGITPILAMVAAAEAAGAEWELVYGGRSRTSMAFLDELRDPRVAIRPQDETGLLDLDALLGVPRAGTLVYCCGPEALLGAVEQRCTAWPAGSLRVERFTAKPLTEPVLSGSFEVELVRSGLTLTVPPDRSILDVAEDAGVGVLSSCSEGTCGTCETPVLEGEVDHRDSVLTNAEQAVGDCMMICVSRARCLRLVLDL